MLRALMTSSGLHNINIPKFSSNVSKSILSHFRDSKKASYNNAGEGKGRNYYSSEVLRPFPNCQANTRKQPQIDRGH